MGLFSKKKKQVEVEEKPILEEGETIDITALDKKAQKDNDLATLAKGIPDIKELIAPSYFELQHTDYLKMGDKWTRSYYLQGYPKVVSVGWLNNIYNSEEDVDVTLYIDPINTGQSLQELNNKITSLIAQRSIELEKGNYKNRDILQEKINNLTIQKRRVEQSATRLFSTQLFFNLYTDSEKALKKASRTFTDFFTGINAKVMPLYMRQDQSFKSTLPYGRTYVTDEQRTASTGQIASMFPFYNAEIDQLHGVTLGVNKMTGNDISVDFYDRSLVLNSNINVFGTSGSGKTYFTGLMTLRSILRGIRSVIIDPEDEYYPLAQALGGSSIDISKDSGQIPNPFDLETEDYFDKKTGEEKTTLNINNKVQDLTKLIHVMYPHMSDLQESYTEQALKAMYEARGFEEGDPRTIYEENASAFTDDGTIQLGKVKKEMPTFSDFWLNLKMFVSNHPEMREEIEVLRKFTRDNSFGLFDTQTPSELEDYGNTPIIVFNINHLEENVMRPIGMFIVMQWAWEKFGKKMVNVKKRLIVDEAWMMLSDNFEGHEYTGKMLETMARRFRKRNGGLMCVSQNFAEFNDSREGRAILTNADSTIFFRQSETDYIKVGQYFKLTAGETEQLQGASKGHFLLKLPHLSAVGIVMGQNQYENQILTQASRDQQKLRR